MKRLIAFVLAIITLFMLPCSTFAYELSSDERDILEKAVMAEASRDFYGQALIAECALNTAVFNGWSIEEVLANYNWTQRQIEPSESAIWAVKSVFDYDYSPSNNGGITVFYNPKLTESSYHESQDFVLEWKNVRFFREFKFTMEEDNMNNKRREKINEIMGELNRIMSKIDDLQSEEDDAYYNLPEGIQMSERGEAMEEASGNLVAASESIDEAMDNLREAMEALDDAKA